MPRDDERLARLSRALDANGLDAFICSLPSNVLLLSGYWPVIGNAVAIATRDAVVGVLAPEDEAAFASASWADVSRTFSSGSLKSLATTAETIRRPLVDLLKSLKLEGARVGVDGSASFDPASYAATFIYGASLRQLLHDGFPDMQIADATEPLFDVRAILTRAELAHVRRACDVARTAFLTTVEAAHPGMRESEIAARLTSEIASVHHERHEAFAWCMSGPNAARAYASFQQSTSRRVENGDSVLLHCNSCCEGYWTDITRTFSIGMPGKQQHAIQTAVFAAARTAAAALAPGIHAATIDHAARDVMERHGYGDAFKHATGHGVGFAAINHNARPRLHPLSPDILEAGMVLNIEPAAYIPDTLGIRHCDMFVVTTDGAECLTPFLGPAH